MIHQVSEALDGNYKQENLWEANQESLSNEATYEQETYMASDNEIMGEEDIEITMDN